MTVGILGMAFKGGSDDTRSSLAYKLRRVLEFKAARVLCTDPYVTTDPRLLPQDQVTAEADLLVIAAPHPAYRTLDTDKPVADIWNVLGNGVLASDGGAAPGLGRGARVQRGRPDHRRP